MCSAPCSSGRLCVRRLALLQTMCSAPCSSGRLCVRRLALLADYVFGALLFCRLCFRRLVLLADYVFGALLFWQTMCSVPCSSADYVFGTLLFWQNMCSAPCSSVRLRVCVRFLVFLSDYVLSYITHTIQRPFFFFNRLYLALPHTPKTLHKGKLSRLLFTGFQLFWQCIKHTWPSNEVSRTAWGACITRLKSPFYIFKSFMNKWGMKTKYVLMCNTKLVGMFGNPTCYLEEFGFKSRLKKQFGLVFLRPCGKIRLQPPQTRLEMIRLW
jgi:hypothetical protein